MKENPSRCKGDKGPVDSISWLDAVAFCKALSRRENKSYRLPTEAEWEYACRAGTSSAFNTGKEELKSSDAWFDRPFEGGSTHHVAAFKPNAWGVYDMHGNVREWCADWYGEYGWSAMVDPKGARSGDARVMRGGAFTDHPGVCRSAVRLWFDPGDRFRNDGFRVAMDAD